MDETTSPLAVWLIHIQAGTVGNIIFIVCSSWFLIDNKNFKLNKVLKLLIDSMMISMIILLGYALAGISFTKDVLIMQIFPDYFGNLWFIPVYCLLYLMHPLLNKIIDNINKKTHFILCFFIMVFYGLNGLYLGWGLGVNQTIRFAFVYFIVAYMKKYCLEFSNNQKKNIICFSILLPIFLLLVFVDIKTKLDIDSLISPIILPMTLCLFNIFKNMKFKNKLINYLAACSLFVYCFHENQLIRSILRPDFYRYMLAINSNYFLCYVIFCAIAMFVIGYLLSILYKSTLSKVSNKLSIIFANIIIAAINFVYNKFFNNKNCEQENLHDENLSEKQIIQN